MSASLCSPAARGELLDQRRRLTGRSAWHQSVSFDQRRAGARNRQGARTACRCATSRSRTLEQAARGLAQRRLDHHQRAAGREPPSAAPAAPPAGERRIALAQELVEHVAEQ